MNKNSELDCYLYFMWNEWNKDVCDKIFPSNLSDHIWNKWHQYCQEHGATGAPARLYAELDSNNHGKIVEYAIKYYNR